MAAEYSKLKQTDDNADLSAIYTPPAYDMFDPSSQFPGGTAATNYLSIVHRNMKLEGTYTVDTSIAPPPLARLFPMEAGSSVGKEPELPESSVAAPRLGPNAIFRTKKEDIEVTLRVKGGKKAEIFVEKSQGNGHVWVDIAEREPGTPLHLKVLGSNTVKLALPSSFRGPIAGGSRKGGLQFSAAWRALGVTTFAIDQQTPLEGKYFIGEWEGCGDQWEGDRLVVTSDNGHVIIGTWEEKEMEQAAKGGAGRRITLDVHDPEVGDRSWASAIRRANWQMWVATVKVPVATWRLIAACVKP
ncbi:hypothetical protein FIBSPDRAFT_1043863 [Athelia psychrophila]|uniref:DUF7330 domain-containing protein n=1 Tax=Athelia psychrophila TaxID=1759441 RepID=A0A166KHZ6_9AGAM|nr:hypothetical protein FIBSPDRAFT_1043863 [Fibularhizoctonia sp. CBS 109695]